MEIAYCEHVGGDRLGDRLSWVCLTHRAYTHPSNYSAAEHNQCKSPISRREKTRQTRYSMYSLMTRKLETRST